MSEHLVPKEMFLQYVAVQGIGAVNMFGYDAIKEFCDEIGLRHLSKMTKEQHLSIMRNYSGYKRDYGDGVCE